MLSSGFALMITGGSQAGFMIELPARHVELGRGVPPQVSPDRIEIGEPTISRVQAWLFWYPEHEAFLIKHEPNATNPTVVNYKVIDEHVLQPGDIVHMGSMSMKFVLADQMQPLKAEGYGPAVPSTDDLGGYASNAGTFGGGAPSSRRSRIGLRVTKGPLADQGRLLSVPDDVLEGSREVTLGGPDGHCEIMLAEPSIAPYLAVLQGQGGKLFIVPQTDTTAIFVRGMPLLPFQACPLAGGEVLTIGGTILTVESADGGASGRADGYLEYLQAPKGTLPAPYALTRQATTIGRVAMCDLMIEDPAISRLHVTIVRREGGHVLKHQSATNKTMVNGTPVRTEKRLEDGDQIRISPNVLFRYVAGEG